MPEVYITQGGRRSADSGWRATVESRRPCQKLRLSSLDRGVQDPLGLKISPGPRAQRPRAQLERVQLPRYSVSRSWGHACRTRLRQRAMHGALAGRRCLAVPPASVMCVPCVALSGPARLPQRGTCQPAFRISCWCRNCEKRTSCLCSVVTRTQSV